MRQRCNITLFVFVILFLFFGEVFAGGGVYWQENGVLVCDSTRWGGITFVSDGKGGAITGWRDERNYFSIYAQRVNKNGNMLWDTNGVPVCYDGTAYLEPDISCVSDGRGGAIFVWVDFVNIVDSAYYNVFVQRIDSMGVCHWGSNGIRVAYADSIQMYPSIVSDGAGGCIVAWEDRRNGNVDIYAQRVDSSGNLLWNDSGVAVCVANGQQYRPQIAYDGFNGAVITWEDHRAGDGQIYAQRLDSNGAQLWGVNGIPVCTLYSGQPSIINVNNNFVISWGDFRNNNVDVYAQKIGLDGSPQWAENGIPICVVDSSQGGTSIIADNCGGVIISWWDYRNGNWDIYSQRVDSSGILLWDSVGVAVCDADSDQEYLSVVSDGRSGAIVTWQDYRNGNWDIYCQRVDSSGVLQWGGGGLPVCVELSYQGHPEIVSDGDCGAIVAWADNRNSGCVYAQRVGDVEGVEETENSDFGFRISDLKVHPNPFTTTTHIKLTLPSSEFRVPSSELRIYNVSGRLVKNLSLGAGHWALETTVVWDGRDNAGKEVKSGIYYIRVKTQRQSFITKVVKINCNK